MSIVAMKRKSRGYNTPISGHGTNGFSLNGGYRNQGWVGQTSISRPVHRTLFKGTEPVGHGGNLGEYNVAIQSGSCCANDSSIIKRSTLTTKGFIDSTVTYPTIIYNTSCVAGLPCHKDTVKSNDPLQSSQELYIKNLSNKMSACTTEKTTSGTYICINPESASYFIGGKKKVLLPYAKKVSSLTSGEYISALLLKKSCISTNVNL